MIVLGLTGSIGMGKSTAANMLRSMRVPVSNADAVVHALLAPGGAGVAPVLAAFPGAKARPKDGGIGGVDRKALRSQLGSDDGRWDKLEHVLHPLVRQVQEQFVQAQRLMGAKVVALDIPLLFETGGEDRFDYMICVTAPWFVQGQRLRARPGFSADDLAFRLLRQFTDAEKRARADFIVQTGLGRGYTYRTLQGIVRALKAGEK